MKKCTFSEQLYYYLIEELDDQPKLAVEQHLQGCADCRAEKQQWQRLLNTYRQLAEMKVNEATLRALRQLVTTELNRKKYQRTSLADILTQRSLLLPLQYVATTIVLVALGFFLGQGKFFTNSSKEALLQSLLTGNSQVRTVQSDIVPYLLGIDKVKFNPQNGMVEIKYNTLNDISYRGDSKNPIVREVLRRALVEETDAAVRMQAVKALAAVAERQKHLDPDFLQAIEYLLHDEQNTGVRLMAVRLLKSLAPDDAVKRLLTQILLYDQDAAVRIQAFEILTGKKAPPEEMVPYLLAAQKDTSSYIRYKAGELLKKISNKKVAEISREE